MFLSAASAILLACLHLVADRIDVGAVVPRSAWLSAASGASVSFVFLMLVPELVARQSALDELAIIGTLAHHTWLLVLLGLVLFYMVEHWMLVHVETRKSSGHGAFWGHVGIFVLYNVVIGYLLFDPHPDVVNSVLLYALALGLHLLVIDDAMRRHHPERYHRVGRWMLAAGLLAGAAIGALVDLYEGIPAVALALLTGGVFLNALKEELPEEREGRMWPFAAGAAIYAALALLVGAM